MAGSIARASRIGVILPLAGIITIALFILMQVLVHTDFLPLPEREQRSPIMIAEYVPDEPVIRILPEPVDTVEPPPIPDLAIETASPSGDTEPVVIGAIEISPPRMSGEEIAQVDFQRDPEPTVRIEPTYPARPLARGTEGSCIVVFDVLGSGRTTNVRAASCDPGFERTSVEAVQRWRYSASSRVGAGEVALSGLTTRLDYRLD